MNVKNALLSVPLSISLLAPVSVFAQTTNSHPDVHATSVSEAKLKADNKKLMQSKAVNPSEEKKILKKMKLDGKAIKLTAGKPLVLNFDDGSKITYELGVEPTPVQNTDPTSGIKTLSISSASTIYKTYHVSKSYYYGTATANTRLYTDVKHVGRYVYVRSNHPYFSGTFARNDFQHTRTIDGTGYGNDMATTELSGQFTLYAVASVADYYTRSYMYRMDIDPAGDCYLRIIY